MGIEANTKLLQLSKSATFNKPKFMQDPMKEKVLKEFQGDVDEASSEVEAYEERYQAAMAEQEAIEAQKNSIFSQLKSDPYNQSLKNKFSLFSKSYSDAEIESDVLRDGLRSRISRLGKLNQTNFIANSVLC